MGKSETLSSNIMADLEAALRNKDREGKRLRPQSWSGDMDAGTRF